MSSSEIDGSSTCIFLFFSGSPLRAAVCWHVSRVSATAFIAGSKVAGKRIVRVSGFVHVIVPFAVCSRCHVGGRSIRRPAWDALVLVLEELKKRVVAVPPPQVATFLGGGPWSDSPASDLERTAATGSRSGTHLGRWTGGAKFKKPLFLCIFWMRQNHGFWLERTSRLGPF